MNNSGISKTFLMAEQQVGWKRLHDDKVITWHHEMTESTVMLANASCCCLPD